VPLDPAIARVSDEGKPFVALLRGSAAANAFSGMVRGLLDAGRVTGSQARAAERAPERRDGNMRFAVPMAEGKLALHFGHCGSFALVDAEDGEIVGREDVPAPEHQPGLLPRWLAERGANVIIAGGMGGRALGLFAEQGIEVAVGAPREEPEELVKAYLAGTLKTGDNVCDH
jgi:predicted Fe-Mo cluster-binding NifX family protein